MTVAAPVDPAAILEIIRQRIAVSDDMWLSGWDKKAETRSPPLYLWWPDRVRDMPSESIGGDAPAVATALVYFIVKIWGRDVAECFAMYMRLRTALELEAGTSVLIGEGRFARPGKITMGMGLEMPVGFKVPVPNTLVDIGTTQATAAILTTTDAVFADGWLELGD